MAETRMMVGPSGMPVEGTVIDILESRERFSEIRLADGTILKTKMVSVEVVRMKDHWDPDGNPVYHVKSQNLVVASVVPDELKRRGA